MAGFGRDKTVDSAGFRGVIPDNTTVPVVIIQNKGTKLMRLKNGANAGKTAVIYKPVFEVLKGVYTGGRVYGDIWCNVEVNPVSGEAIVFGSHMTFCDLCDIADIHEEDGGYPIAVNESEGNMIANKMIGKPCFITVGQRDYMKGDTKVFINTVKSVVAMNEDQIASIKDEITPIMERVAKQEAKARANAGGSGLEDEDDGDMPF